MTGLDPMWQCFAVALAAWTQRKLRCWGPGMVQVCPGMVQLGVSHHDRLEIPFCMPRIPGS